MKEWSEYKKNKIEINPINFQINILKVTNILKLIIQDYI